MGRERCATHGILTPSPTNNGNRCPVGAGLPVFLIGDGIYWLVRRRAAEKGKVEDLNPQATALVIA
jgi:hypothetical protein